MTRLLGNVTAALLAGVLVNLVIAWWCAAAAPRRLYPTVPAALRSRLPDDSMARTPASIEEIDWIHDNGWRSPVDLQPFDSVVTYKQLGGPGFVERCYEWSTVIAHSSVGVMVLPTRSQPIGSVVETGWPWSSMAGTRWDGTPDLETLQPGWSGLEIFRFDDKGEHVYVDAVPLPKKLGPLSFESLRLLPLRPLWPGFLLGTLLWGGAAWLLVRGPRELVCIIREFCGRCARCGYALQGSAGGCPECGQGR